MGQTEVLCYEGCREAADDTNNYLKHMTLWKSREWGKIAPEYYKTDAAMLQNRKDTLST